MIEQYPLYARATPCEKGHTWNGTFVAIDVESGVIAQSRDCQLCGFLDVRQVQGVAWSR